MFLIEDKVNTLAEEASAAERGGVYAVISHYWPPIGVDRLDLYLTNIPRHRLYDVRSARFQSAANDVVQYFTISHPTVVRGSKPICPGLFTIYAQGGLHFWEGLTFGGTVTITGRINYTHVEVASPAPIFVLAGDADPIQHLLFDELMAAIARHRAEVHESDAEYARRLAAVDPYQLFLASLHTMDELSRHGAPSLIGSHHVEVRRAVQRMLDAVRKADGWPAHVARLEELV